MELTHHGTHFEAKTLDGQLQVYPATDGTIFIHARHDDRRIRGVSIDPADLDQLVGALYRVRAALQAERSNTDA